MLLPKLAEMKGVRIQHNSNNNANSQIFTLHQ
jgi:hypothetical protein